MWVRHVGDSRALEEEEEEWLEEAADKLFSTIVESLVILHVTIRTRHIHPISIVDSLTM